MNEHAQSLVDEILAPKADTGKSFNICPDITNAALDVICESSMGQHVDAQHNTGSEYLWATNRINEIIKDRVVSKLLATEKK